SPTDFHADGVPRLGIISDTDSYESCSSSIATPPSFAFSGGDFNFVGTHRDKRNRARSSCPLGVKITTSASARSAGFVNISSNQYQRSKLAVMPRFIVTCP